MQLLIIFGIALILVIAYVLTTYNKFVKVKTRISASIQEIGNQLKRQASLIPNLVESVKGYMKHEKEIFKEIAEARKSVTSALESQSTEKMIEAGEKLQSALAPIQAVFESTPELKAAEPTVKLMDEVRDTADKIAYSRRTLIDLTADYNEMIATFPSKLVASIFGFKKEPGLTTPKSGDHVSVSAEDVKEPKVKL